MLYVFILHAYIYRYTHLYMCICVYMYLYINCTCMYVQIDVKMAVQLNSTYTLFINQINLHPIEQKTVDLGLTATPLFRRLCNHLIHKCKLQLLSVEEMSHLHVNCPFLSTPQQHYTTVNIHFILSVSLFVLSTTLTRVLLIF